MRPWIIICLFLSACDPQIITRFEKILIHDTLYRTHYNQYDSFQPIRNAQIRRESFERRTSSDNKSNDEKTVEKKVVITRNIVKTVYGNPGMLLYDIPDSMVLEKLYKIKIRIQTHTNSIDSKGTNNPVTNTIQTSRKMEVDLKDPDPEGAFKITKANADQQIVETEFYTEWIFDVYPIKSGKRTLNLVVSVITDDGVKQIVYEDMVIIKNRISVKIESFWEKYWQWIFSTFLIPIFIYFWKRKQKNKESAN